MESDPTKIDMMWTPGKTSPRHADPRIAETKGMTYHGNLKFHCSFITEVAENLWMGGVAFDLFLPEEIEHVVSLYRWESYENHDNVKSTLTVEMFDGAHIDPDEVVAIAQWVNHARTKGPTLVHCQAGLNRSGLVVATALALEGQNIFDVVAHLRDTRSPAVLCNPKFAMWLGERFGGVPRGA